MIWRWRWSTRLCSFVQVHGFLVGRSLHAYGLVDRPGVQYEAGC
jgi:hypothetical protein